MDLLQEYASDSSATADGNSAPAKSRGNATDSAFSAPAPAQNNAEGPDAAKPVAQEVSGNFNNKSGTSTSVGKPHRVCAACKETKNRDEYSKNQWNKSHGKGPCKPCVGAPERPPRPAAAKRQKLNPQRDQTKRSVDDVRIRVKLGTQWLPFVIDKKKTVNDLKQLVCGDYFAGGMDPRYCHFRNYHSFRRLMTSSTLEHCLAGTWASREPSLDLLGRRHQTNLDLVQYLFRTDYLVDIFRNSCPFRTISHPSDIHDLVGNYDIIYADERSINLEAIPGLRMEIRPRGTDHIEGSVFGRCLSLFQSDRDYITFNTDTPWVSDNPDFDINDLTDEYPDKCQMVGIVKHEGDDETSLDYDSDEEIPDRHIGSIFVLKQRALVPRAGSVDVMIFLLRKVSDY